MEPGIKFLGFRHGKDGKSVVQGDRRSVAGKQVSKGKSHSTMLKPKIKARCRRPYRTPAEEKRDTISVVGNVENRLGGRTGSPRSRHRWKIPAKEAAIAELTNVLMSIDTDKESLPALGP